MKGPVRALLMLLVVASPAVAVQAQMAIPFDARKFEQTWNQAHLDADTRALDALWADDITIVVPGMTPLGKADALKMWNDVPVTFTRYESTGIAAKVEGPVAVVTGRIARARSFGERSAQEQWYFTKVYRFSDSAWRVIAFHASSAPD